MRFQSCRFVPGSSFYIGADIKIFTPKVFFNSFIKCDALCVRSAHMLKDRRVSVRFCE